MITTSTIFVAAVLLGYAVDLTGPNNMFLTEFQQRTEISSVESEENPDASSRTSRGLDTGFLGFAIFLSGGLLVGWSMRRTPGEAEEHDDTLCVLAANSIWAFRLVAARIGNQGMRETYSSLNGHQLEVEADPSSSSN